MADTPQTRYLLARAHAGMGTTRKTWADRIGLATGVIGERHKGILISEENRATKYFIKRADLEQLRIDLHNNFRRKRINAVIFGIETPHAILYAIFASNWKGRQQ